MPSFVITEKCDGCQGQDKTACMYICPHDLMVLDKDKMKAVNQEPVQCWECYNCVKICPQQAIEVRGYAEFAEGDWQAGCDRHLCSGDQFFPDWNGILHRVLQ
jgi:adenosine phosphosulfate reductase beta subunit